MEKPESDIIRKIKEFIVKFERKTHFEELSTKYKEPLVFISVFFTIIGTMICLITVFGILVGLIVSILIICIGLFVLRSIYLRIISKASDSIDLKKNLQNKRTGKLPIGKVIVFSFILLVSCLLYVNFHTYFVDPEITITSPRSGDVVTFDNDNTFLKISGTSKGLVNNQFFHLFILCRRVDSNQESGEWYYDYSPFRDDTTVYNDGSWEYRIQLIQLDELIEETLFIKSVTNQHNNISTNVDIVAIITKQPIKHSIFTKFLTKAAHVRNKVDGPVWYKWILVLLPTRIGTFYDEFYEPPWRESLSPVGFDYWTDFYHLPKHLADDHVTITPLIVDYTGSWDTKMAKHGLDDDVTSADARIDHYNTGSLYTDTPKHGESDGDTHNTGSQDKYTETRGVNGGSDVKGGYTPSTGGASCKNISIEDYREA